MCGIHAINEIFSYPIWGRDVTISGQLPSRGGAVGDGDTKERQVVGGRMAEIIKLAPGVSEVMRQRLGKIETMLTAEGVAGIQGIVEIDRDFWEALQYIHSAQTEMLAGNVHLAIQKYWDAYNLAVEKHGASLLSRQVVHSLVDSTT
jgi:hypothetical protein